MSEQLINDFIDINGYELLHYFLATSVVLHIGMLAELFYSLYLKIENRKEMKK